MLINKAQELLKEVKELLAADSSKQRIPGNTFFMKEGNVLCLDRQNGETRFPYANDGYILWAHSTGHFHVKSGIFNVFRPIYDGNEINVEFIVGIQDEKGDYFPLSLSGGAKQVYEPFNVKRYVVYTLSAAYYITETDIADFVLRASMSKKKELQFSVGFFNKTKKPLPMYLISYFDPFLKDGEADNMWEHRGRRGKYLGGGKFVAYRGNSVRIALGIKRKFTNVKVHSSEATLSRGGILGSDRGFLSSSPVLRTGKLFTEALISGATIAAEISTFDLDKEGRADFVLPLDMLGGQIDEMLAEPIDEKAIDATVEALDKEERAKFDNLDIVFDGFADGKVNAFTLNHFVKKVQKQVDNCAMGRYYVDDLMGVRDVYQQLEQALIWNDKNARKQMLSALSFLLPDGRAPRQYSLPVKEGDRPKMDWREFIDQGNWIISCFYSYLAWTGDYGILDEELGYSEKVSWDRAVCRTDINDSALQHLLKVADFLLRNLDTEDGTNCLRILFGDWNDALDGLGRTTDEGKQYGTGVSIMASLHLYQNLLEMVEILKKVGGYEDKIAEYLKAREILKAGILKNAIVTNDKGEKRLLHGWGDHGSYKVGSFCDSDGESRISFAPNAFWATSGLIEETPELKELIVESLLSLSSQFGLKTLAPAFQPTAPGIGRLANVPKGTAENECVYIHASMFSILALFKLGKAERAWEEFYKILPIANQQTTKTPFVMSNSYLDNPEMGYFGQSPIDWYTGSGTVCIKNIVRGLIGVIPNLDGITVQTANKMPCKKVTMDCTIKGKNVRFEYKNTGAGKRNVYFNGKALETEYDALMETQKAFVPECALMETNILKIKKEQHW